MNAIPRMLNYGYIIMFPRYIVCFIIILHSCQSWEPFKYNKIIADESRIMLKANDISRIPKRDLPYIYIFDCKVKEVFATQDGDMLAKVNITKAIHGIMLEGDDTIVVTKNDPIDGIVFEKDHKYRVLAVMFNLNLITWRNTGTYDIDLE